MKNSYLKKLIAKILIVTLIVNMQSSVFMSNVFANVIDEQKNIASISDTTENDTSDKENYEDEENDNINEEYTEEPEEELSEKSEKEIEKQNDNDTENEDTENNEIKEYAEEQKNENDDNEQIENDEAISSPSEVAELEEELSEELEKVADENEEEISSPSETTNNTIPIEELEEELSEEQEENTNEVLSSPSNLLEALTNIDLDELAVSEVTEPTPSEIENKMLFGADPVCGIDYGYWYVTNESGDRGEADLSTYNVLHLTTNVEPPEDKKSGKFTFGELTNNNFPNVYQNVKKVMFDSDFTPTDVSYLFKEFINITEIVNIDKLKTENVTRMNMMFSFCESLISLDLSSFNTENVNNMSSMFINCTSLTNLNLSSFNTENVNDMSSMFAGCEAFTNLDLSCFNTENVRFMNAMFTNCVSMTNLNLSSFNTANVENMLTMFAYCEELIQLDLSSFEFGKSAILNMTQMFLYCSKLEKIYVDENKIHNDRLTELSSADEILFIFSGCYNLYGGNGTKFSSDRIKLLYAKVDKVGQVGYFSDKNISHEIKREITYYGNISTTKGTVEVRNNNATMIDAPRFAIGQEINIKITTFDEFEPNKVKIIATKSDGSYAINTTASFSSKSGNAYIYIYTIPTSLEEGLDILISADIKLKPNGGFWYISDASGNKGSVNPDTYNILHLTTAEQELVEGKSGKFLFGKESSINFPNVYNVVNKVVLDSEFTPTSTAHLFKDFEKITQIENISKLKTNNVTDMQYMFSNCKLITSLDLSSFNTANVNNMKDMFLHCDKLINLNISNFNTAAVTNMYEMFRDCQQIKNINVSNFNTSNVENMENMFAYCYALENLDLSMFNTSLVSKMKNMFIDCHSLVSLNVSHFDASHINSMESMFENCYVLKNLDLSSFNVSNVNKMQSIFKNCYAIESIDMSSIEIGRSDVSASTSLKDAFLNCGNLNVIYTSDDKVHTNFIIPDEEIFRGCINLYGGNGTKYNESNIKRDWANVEELNGVGYFTDKTMSHEIEISPTLTNVGVYRGGARPTDYVIPRAYWHQEIIITYPETLNPNEIIIYDKDNKDNIFTSYTTDTTNRKITFSMPYRSVIGDMVIDKAFVITKKINGSTSGSGGSYTLSKTNALANDKATISDISPSAGKAFKELKIYKTNDTSVNIPYTKIGDKYEFTMPADPVTVDIIFDNLWTISTVSQTEVSYNVDKLTAFANETVTISNLVANVGYQLNGIKVYKTGDESTLVTVNSTGNVYTFTMPNYNVTIKGLYKVIYNNNKFSEGIGTFSINPENAIYGTNITIENISANAGYKFYSINVTNASTSTAIPLTTVSEASKYTYTMPEANVNVKVTFKQIKNVTTIASTGGTYTVGKDGESAGVSTSGILGDKIFINLNQNTGFELDAIKILDTDNSDIDITSSVNLTNITNTRYSFTMPDSNVKVKVTYKMINYTITKVTPVNGDFEVVNTATYSSVVMINNIIPNTNYLLDKVSVYETDHETATISVIKIDDSTYSFTMPAKDVSVKVTFKITFAITKNESVATYDVDKVRTYVGDTVTISNLSPLAGYQINELIAYKTGDEGTVVTLTELSSPKRWQFTMPAYDVTLTTRYSVIYNNNKTVDGNGNYTITPTSAVSGTTITIENISPISGNKFYKIEVTNASTSEAISLSTISEASKYTYTMPEANVNIKVTFKQIKNVTTIASTGGTYTIGKDGESAGASTSGILGDKIFINLNQNTGFELDAIKILDTDNSDIDITSSVNLTNITNTKYSFIMPDSNVKVKVTYKMINYTITKVTPVNGDFEVVNTSTYSNVVTISNITPDTNYLFDTIKVYETLTPANEIPTTKIDDSTYTFTMPAKDVSVKVTFKITYAITKNESVATYDVDKVRTYVGDTVTISNLSPLAGHEVNGLFVYKTGDENTLISLDTTGSTWSFTMPSFDVTIEAVFKTIHNNIKEIEGSGNYIVTPESAIIGTNINIKNITPSSGFRFYKISAINASTSDAIPLTAITKGSHYTYMMPEADVNTKVTFKKIRNIKKETVKGGSYTVEPINAIVDDKIYININVDNDYEYDTLKIINTDNNADITDKVTLKRLSSTKFCFIMPDNDVLVKVSFKKKYIPPTPTPTPSGGGSSSGGGSGKSVPFSTDPAKDNAIVCGIKTDVYVPEENSSWQYNIEDNTWSIFIEIGNEKAYLNNGFYHIKDSVYYFDSNGKMATGWVKDPYNNYYLFEFENTENKGKMIVGWRMVNSKWYYFTSNGNLLVNNYSPDGYYVDENGVWTPPTGNTSTGIIQT